MKKNPATGAIYLLKGVKLITKPGIREVVIIPLLINLCVFSALIWFGIYEFNNFIEWAIPDGLEWLRFLLWPVFSSGLLIVMFFSFSLCANLIASPFNSILAKRTERYLMGKSIEEKPPLKGKAYEIISSIVSEFKKMFYFLKWSSILLLLSMIPLINIIAPVLWTIFTAWMLSLEYMDYPMSNNNLMFKDVRERLRDKGLQSITLGGAILLLTVIPFVNFFAMPIAVCGSTVMWVEEWRN